jgi:serine protease Do
VRAKQAVFPSVVFVKPVLETFEGGEKKAHEVAGSGVIISPAGECLTNWHVVEKARRIRCLLYDGRSMDARVIGQDKETDLALIQLDVGAGTPALPAARLGNSDAMSEGDFVMAMGAPWGMSRSVSLGIIMCTRRYLPGGSEHVLWLQTDASLSPGNSGGPLVNVEGEVIGINTAAALLAGDLGFALPSNLIKELLPQLRAGGELQRSWSGLRLQPLNDFERDMYFGGDRGVIVAGSDPGSPAEQAGFQVGDRILELNGAPVTARSAEDLPAIRQAFARLPKGEVAVLKVERAGSVLAVELTPRMKGEVEGEELECARWQMTVKAINRFADPDLYFHRQTGVFVSGVKEPGNARASGLRVNDILLTIDGRAIGSLDEMKKVYEELSEPGKGKTKAVVEVLRNGLQRVVVLDYSWKYEE